MRCNIKFQSGNSIFKFLQYEKPNRKFYFSLLRRIEFSIQPRTASNSLKYNFGLIFMRYHGNITFKSTQSKLQPLGHRYDKYPIYCNSNSANNIVVMQFSSSFQFLFFYYYYFSYFRQAYTFNETVTTIIILTMYRYDQPASKIHFITFYYRHIEPHVMTILSFVA